jgi:hypothetical protein
MTDITHTLLNESGIRETLREQFPHLDKLESLDCLKDLRLTGIKTRGSFIGLDYEATATEDFYPQVRSKLIEKGIGSKNSIFLGGIGCKGTTNEYEEVMISFSGAQTSLTVYNPGYNPEQSD